MIEHVRTAQRSHREDHSTDTPGQRLKRVRERLQLRYREVEEASQRIAERRGSPEYAIAISRLADIENKGVIPNIFRVYSLCAIYRLEIPELLRWYGIYPDQLPTESARLPLSATHLAPIAEAPVNGSRSSDCEIAETGGDDGLRTTFLSRIHRLGRMSATLLAGIDSQHFRYGYIGLEDRTMYPLLQPGSLVIIDIRRRKIASGGWTSEHQRPIYFLEHRGGYSCGWCTVSADRLILQPHPASMHAPAVYRYPDEIEVVGQVVGTAMLLDFRSPAARTSTTPVESPSR